MHQPSPSLASLAASAGQASKVALAWLAASAGLAGKVALASLATSARRVSKVVVAAGVLAAALGAQGPPPGQAGGGRGGGPAPALRTGTGLILGRVVDGSSARGIADAVVDLNSQ